MEKNQLAKDIYHTYRLRAEQELDALTHLRETFPSGDFPKHRARIKRYGLLAWTWAKIATVLSGGKVDYLAQWRAGR